MDLFYNEKYPPRNDLIFAIMFSGRDTGKVLFAELLKSVTGHTLNTEEVLSQANYPPENIDHNYIRFDTYAKDSNGTIYSIDLQNTYAEQLIKNRTIYYACRAIAGQTVNKGAYHQLNEVVVSFIMTKKDNAEPVEIIHLYNQNHEIYSQLLTLYNVYVPSVNADEKGNIEQNLKIFSEFFSADSQESLEKFYEKYSQSILANQLLSLYNEAIGRDDLDILIGKEYFDMKITEQDFIEARIECEAKGREKGRAEGRAEGKIKEDIRILQRMKKAGHTIKEMANIFDMSEAEVENMLAMQA